MTREELQRVLKFASALKALGEDRTSLSTVDARWNIIAYAMRRHLDGKLLTISSLANAANVPYGTAMRRITELMDEGLLLRRPRSSSGKSFSLHPTRALIAQFETFATEIKRTVGETFGFLEVGSDAVDDPFYFGGHYMASRILSYPNAMRVGIAQDRPVRILGPIDPTFQTLKSMLPQLKELCGAPFEFTNLPLDELHCEICKDRTRLKSKYDIVAVDLPWIGELAASETIMPLDPLIAENKYRSTDFHATIWNAAQFGGKQWGIPIQPTVELLFCRKDVMGDAGLAVPGSTQELLLAAKTLNGFRRGQSGIVMNFGRGMPVAHTFIQTLADFGSPFIDLPKAVDGFDTESIGGSDYRPLIDTQAGRDTAEFLTELLQYSHPESLVCDWDRRISIFSEGKAAMSYGWSIRAAKFELDDTMDAHGNVIFAPHPPRAGLNPVSPVGGFALAIPTSIAAGREHTAWKAMEYLTRPEMMKLYVQNGNLTSPRFSTSADPEVRAISGMIRDIDMMEQNGTLQVWPRPPIPEFADVVSILGEEIHAMLQGQTSIAAALATAQGRIDKVFQTRRN